MHRIRLQDGATALFKAADLGHTDFTKLLLDKGADVNSRDKVSNMIWGIVGVIACVSDCIMRQCGSVVTISTSIDVNVIRITHKCIYYTSTYSDV